MRAKAGVDARTPWRRSGYSLDILKEALLVARPRKRNTIQRAAPGARKVMTGRMSAFGPKRTLTCAPQMSAFEEKADMLLTQWDKKRLREALQKVSGQRDCHQAYGDWAARTI